MSAGRFFPAQIQICLHPGAEAAQDAFLLIVQDEQGMAQQRLFPLPAQRARVDLIGQQGHFPHAEGREIMDEEDGEGRAAQLTHHLLLLPGQQSRIRADERAAAEEIRVLNSFDFLIYPSRSHKA